MNSALAQQNTDLPTEVFNSALFDERTFYQTFNQDLALCKKEVIIESPYITTERVKMFRPIFEKLIKIDTKIYVITRDPTEHDDNLEYQSERAIRSFEIMGVQVLLCKGNHHRKLAILDRRILWEGSLNILSQTRSREIMRRIESAKVTLEMFSFLNLKRFL